LLNSDGFHEKHLFSTKNEQFLIQFNQILRAPPLRKNLR
jgi:hypothetical protein